MSDYPYVVRGAQIYCTFGSHVRRIDMPACHGSYIREKPNMHEMDCKVGLDANIPPFGICSSPANPGQEIMISDAGGLVPMQDEHGNSVMPTMPIIGKLCQPILADKWCNAYEDTLIDGVPALRVNCTISCVFNGTICFADDGQKTG